jgi:hypothetical protein
LMIDDGRRDRREERRSRGLYNGARQTIEAAANRSVFPR